jgi:LmbE family N-acetylglucosaminyl deacetylase
MAGLLVFIAHPDDEFFCAGLIAALVRRSIPVRLVCWTGGEGGPLPKSRYRLRFPYFLRPRIREMRRSAAQLGATSLTFLRYADPPPRQGPAAPLFEPSKLQRTLLHLIIHHKAEMVVTHGSNGDYGHPAHQALSHLLRELAREPGTAPFPLFSFNATWPGAPEVRFLNRDDPADCLFDSRPYLREKRRVLLAHLSQARVMKNLITTSNPSTTRLLRQTRFEGYRCWNETPLREAALLKFHAWTDASHLSARPDEVKPAATS